MVNKQQFCAAKLAKRANYASSVKTDAKVMLAQSIIKTFLLELEFTDLIISHKLQILLQIHCRLQYSLHGTN